MGWCLWAASEVLIGSDHNGKSPKQKGPSKAMIVYHSPRCSLIHLSPLAITVYSSG
jgi:hypothetical protein